MAMCSFEAWELGEKPVATSSATNMEVLHWFFRDNKWRASSLAQRQQLVDLLQEARLVVQEESPSDQASVPEVRYIVEQARKGFITGSSKAEQAHLITSWIGRLT